jgi:3-methylcrotonyl-CoA carboxylase alpha subunit
VFQSVLIANRGEIACRIIRTARRLGLRAIAVYSDADASARHVREADEALRIGGAAARDSYLSVPALLAAARASGAQAIHPGYGFLSENAQFAAACAEAGLVFVGPPVAALKAMGSKSVAKETMQRAGVPVLPGYQGEDQSLARLTEEANRLGFPLMVKPSAGGGGKGMAIVGDAASLGQALAGARRLALSAFGDGSLLLERYLPAPRHVEVQVLADQHGTVLHLFDRDCSVQRRHQKLIEEAPAPAIPDPVRARLHEAAIAVARAASYVSAGTVEFLYSDDAFWFMEMNTRLQVEHPVTEAITRLDLVEWQLRIAAGEAIPFSQNDITARGHAVEVRVCAEDPEQDFAPSSGVLRHLKWPNLPGLRVDAGFDEGDRVPPDYDSLLAKIIAHGATRELAVERLSAGLAQTRLVGLDSNLDWLARAIGTEGFRGALLSTQFLELHAGELVAGPATPEIAAIAAVIMAELGRRPVEERASPWAIADAFRPNLPHRRDEHLRSGTQEFRVSLEDGPQGWQARVADYQAVLVWHAEQLGRGYVSLAESTRPVDYWTDSETLHVWISGRHWRLARVDARRERAESTAQVGELTTRLPGTVVSVAVGVGDRVSAGQVLMTVEAMKMEHAIAAPYAGRVRALRFAAGERVPEGAVLIELDGESAADL